MKSVSRYLCLVLLLVGALRPAVAVPAAPVVTKITSTGSIVGMCSDPTRVRIYVGVKNGTNAGSVVAFDPLASKVVATIQLGSVPTALAVKANGTELAVLCAGNKSISIVNLGVLKVTDTFALPAFTVDYRGNENTARVAFGPAGTLYYTDEDYEPPLRVFDRATRTVRQTLTKVGPAHWGGISALAVSGDWRYLYGLTYSNDHYLEESYVIRYAIDSHGLLSHPTWGDNGQLKSWGPLEVSNDGQTFVADRQLFASRSFPAYARELYQDSGNDKFVAMTRGGEVLMMATGLYSAATGQRLGEMPYPGMITTDYSRVVSVADTRSVRVVRLGDYVNWSTVGLTHLPANKTTTSATVRLQWGPRENVIRHRVYLGSSATAVNNATTKSAEYLGETVYKSKVPKKALTPGRTYYWRVDSVWADGRVTKGTMTSFKVSALKVSAGSVTARTVQLDPGHVEALKLTSTKAGVAWQAKSSASWLTLSAASGKTPATLKLTMDPRQLSVGQHTATINLTTVDGTFAVPVDFTVEGANITLIRSMRNSARVYAVSEGTDANAHAYLIEANALTEQVTRVAEAGTSVTDMAIHRGDNRVYVTNWGSGLLRGFSISSMAQMKPVQFPPGGVFGSDGLDTISAGAAGRLAMEFSGYDELENPTAHMEVMQTKPSFHRYAELLPGTNIYPGEGQFDPTGRYYYRKDDLGLHRYDTTGNALTEIDRADLCVLRPVVSEAGRRVFSGCYVYNADLSVLERTLEDLVYSVSGDGHYAFGRTFIYDVDTGEKVAAMPYATAVSAFNVSTGRLVVSDGASFNFSSPVGPGLLGAAASPADQATVRPPTHLHWTALPGVSSYRVYFGPSSSAVAAAGTGSAEYLGTVNTTSIALNEAMTAGSTYYWRVDPVTSDGIVVTGSVASFTLYGLPAISSVGPTRSVIAPGAAYALTVQATGTGTLHYQWRHNGRPIAGATAATLNVASATLADDGWYGVDVTDDIGTQRSAPCFALVASAATEVLAWGDPANAAATVPLELSDAVALAAGTGHALAVRADGTVTAWGANDSGQTTVPTGLGDVVAVAAGAAHSLALKADGTVVAWGDNSQNQATVPASLSNVVAIAASGNVSAALRSDGTVAVWGEVTGPTQAGVQSAVSAVAVAAGTAHVVVAKSDGTVSAWGADTVGEVDVPAGLSDVIVVAASGRHTLALKADGTVVAWGEDASGQSTVLGGLSGVVALAAGPNHSLALKADGTVVAWGADGAGQTDIPSGLAGVEAVAGGGDLSLALCDASVLP